MTAAEKTTAAADKAEVKADDKAAAKAAADTAKALELTDEQKVVRKAAADDRALEEKRVAFEKAEEEKRAAAAKEAEKAGKEDDVKLLTESGNWKPAKDDEGMWVNKTRFTCSNEAGRTQSVPDGIVRHTAEAARLERMRPKAS